MLIASGLLALLIGAAFAVLLSSVAELRASERRARQSEEVLVVANRLERLVVDLETGQRGFVITGQERFLRPWRDAQQRLPGGGRHPGAAGRGTTPSSRRGPGASSRPPRPTSGTTRSRWWPPPGESRARHGQMSATEEGRRRMDAIRAEFDRLPGGRACAGGGA